MKFIFAPDSFKGTITAVQACDMLEVAARRHFPAAAIEKLPVADGGEGTVQALTMAMRGYLESVVVSGPMGEPVRAAYGVSADGKTAIIEVAQSSGLTLVPPESRNPIVASSYGTGELIAHVARKAGIERILVGLGGSATNDGGMGMLSALGAHFADANGKQLTGSGDVLSHVAKVSLSGLLPALAGVEIAAISDVTNLLLGPDGATAVYGPQKGATDAMAESLEAGMTNYAKAVSAAMGKDITSFPGAGAAGGIGASLDGVLGTKIYPGVDFVLDVLGFEDRLRDASLVITGEGRLDAQSIRYGKAPVGVAKRCAAHGVPVIAFVGGMGDGAAAFCDIGDASIMVTADGTMPVQAALDNAVELFASAADRMFRMLKIGGQLGKESAT